MKTLSFFALASLTLFSSPAFSKEIMCKCTSDDVTRVYGDNVPHVTRIFFGSIVGDGTSLSEAVENARLKCAARISPNNPEAVAADVDCQSDAHQACNR